MARSDPYSGFRFKVSIDQVRAGGFSRVKGLQRETKVESYREGGANEFEHKLMTSTSYANLVLERGLLDPSLWNWHQDVVEGRVKRRTVTITLEDERQAEVWSWTAQAAYPVKWSTGDFDAASGQVSVESVELVHHGLLRRPGGASA